MQAPQETTNTPAPRMLDCIYLSPAYNTQGGHILFNLHTKSIIAQHYVISIPIPPSMIDLVNDMGKDDGMTDIEFRTKHKKLIWDSSLIAGVDYEPSNEEQVDEGDDNEDDDYDPNQDQVNNNIPLTYDTDDEDEGIPVDDTPSTASESESEDEGNVDEDDFNHSESPNQDQEQSIGEVAGGLDNIMQPPNEEVIFESKLTDERVEFIQALAGEAPTLRRSARESKPADIWTYSHAQAAKMAKHIHICFTPLMQVQRNLDKKAMMQLTRRLGNYIAEED